EPIAVQVTGAELVAVTRGREHAHAVDLDRSRTLGVAAQKRRGLNGDRMSILQPGPAGFARIDVEGARDALHGLGRGEPALLEGHVEVITLAARRVRGNLFDAKVFGVRAQLAADRRDG